MTVEGLNQIIAGSLNPPATPVRLPNGPRRTVCFRGFWQRPMDGNVRHFQSAGDTETVPSTSQCWPQIGGIPSDLPARRTCNHLETTWETVWVLCLQAIGVLVTTGEFASLCFVRFGPFFPFSFWPLLRSNGAISRAPIGRNWGELVNANSGISFSIAIGLGALATDVGKLCSDIIIVVF